MKQHTGYLEFQVAGTHWHSMSSKSLLPGREDSCRQQGVTTGTSGSKKIDKEKLIKIKYQH